ncbi:branched-chain amino acid ABC transporter permease [Amycolatopsis viridis]|uniref:Branched-chain amino acid transport system permease protein n=1 Tax=Amycolatopsis viridis TaxID=185678 RepID=A0ABX0T0J4_9PSEU|nr:branched-chain amino acid ABC transporter permease [Amycolatopsis viridis]NIH82758.1 branched-chain amino acid transport system permease protein [Amycolatopsis viridis]
MNPVSEILVPGLTFGSLYALVAIGLNVLYRPTNVLNFAQGDLVMVGAMLMAATGLGGLPWPLALVCVVVVVGLIALLEERLAVTPVLRRSGHAAGWVITTLAFSLILSQVAGRIWTAEPRSVAPPAPLSLRPMDLWGLQISSYQLVVIGVVVVLVAGLELGDRTRFGCAVRAVAADRDGARLQGIRPDRIGRVSFLIGGALAGLAGVLAAPLLLASVTMGFGLLIRGFFAAIVGGVGDHRGALVAGWLLGVVEAVGARYVSPGMQTAVLFGVVVVVLMVRPTGLRRSGGVLRHV